ncbi:hypothetical protein [Nocardioides sp.]|uniref:hypothetical protein n=1 Tax=Nocardioides sp. TaxID=35761 RepID=UPI003564E50D
MRRLLAAAAIIALPLILSTGCSESPGPSDSAPPERQTIEITFSDGSVTPNGERVQIEAGTPIELVVKSDTAGELHVHSSPEQQLEYGAGTTTLKLTIQTPGVVDIESHSPARTIVQLEVR